MSASNGDRFGSMAWVDVMPKPVDWVWPGRLALGSMVLAVGPTGIGMSIFLGAIAARVSRGGPWPDGASPTHPAR
jgi:AAA domain